MVNFPKSWLIKAVITPSGATIAVDEDAYRYSCSVGRALTSELGDIRFTSHGPSAPTGRLVTKRPPPTPLSHQSGPPKRPISLQLLDDLAQPQTERLDLRCEGPGKLVEGIRGAGLLWDVIEAI
jgi:hypothetical protein